MNEILAVIYYIFAQDPHPEFKEHFEADSFYCFSILMGDLKDNFIQCFDKTQSGICSKLKQLDSKLKSVDFVLWTHLQKHEINPQFYALSWIMLGLAQEFTLKKAARLWDALMGRKNKK